MKPDPIEHPSENVGITELPGVAAARDGARGTQSN